MKVTLQHHLWEGGEPIRMLLPDRWRVKALQMKGDGLTPLSGDDYRKFLSALRPLIKGKKEICVLFDDLSRPTRAFEIVPHLLEIFEECGIQDEQVRFICALGTHAALDNAAFRKKLGEDTLERFPVYNHNPYENCERIGTTKLGTPVIVNREYLSCDVRIGIGAFVAHPFCGFSGGYKIVMPGISHIEAVEYHHGPLLRKCGEFAGLGRFRDNPLLEDVKECGRIARLDAKIDVLVNTSGEHVDLYAGPAEGVYEAMTEKALLHYSTNVPGKADIVFANAYGKGNEAWIAMSQAESLLKDTGGDVAFICDIAAGQVVHYLFGRFGNNIGGRLCSDGMSTRLQSPKVRRIFIFSRYKDVVGSSSFGSSDSIVWMSDIDKLIGRLDEEHREKAPDVFILPDATLQLL